MLSGWLALPVFLMHQIAINSLLRLEETLLAFLVFRSSSCLQRIEQFSRRSVNRRLTNCHLILEGFIPIQFMH